jgi:hypothetical protein
MKKYFSSIVVILYVSVLNISSFKVYADDPGFPIGNDPGEPVPETPIEGWIPFMLIIGLVMVFYYVQKNKVVKQ